MEACFCSSDGPGRLPQKQHKSFVQGLLSPHGSLQLSGKCAAWGYLSVAEAIPPDLFIILGPDHVNPGLSAIQIQSCDCNTPFGRLPVARGWINDLAKLYPCPFEYNTIAIFREHSLEMQFIFLAYLRKLTGLNVPILPILIGQNARKNAESFQALQTFASVLRQVIYQRKAHICLIASGDLTHYGQFYNYTPFGTEITPDLTEKVAAFDQERLELIRAKNAKGFLESTQSTSYCATLPVYALLETLGPVEITTLSYSIAMAHASDASKLFTSFACMQMI